MRNELDPTSGGPTSPGPAKDKRGACNLSTTTGGDCTQGETTRCSPRCAVTKKRDRLGRWTGIPGKKPARTTQMNRPNRNSGGKGGWKVSGEGVGGGKAAGLGRLVSGEEAGTASWDTELEGEGDSCGLPWVAFWGRRGGWGSCPVGKKGGVFGAVGEVAGGNGFPTGKGTGGGRGIPSALGKSGTFHLKGSLVEREHWKKFAVGSGLPALTIEEGRAWMNTKEGKKSTFQRASVASLRGTVVRVGGPTQPRRLRLQVPTARLPHQERGENRPNCPRIKAKWQLRSTEKKGVPAFCLPHRRGEGTPDLAGRNGSGSFAPGAPEKGGVRRTNRGRAALWSGLRKERLERRRGSTVATEG